MYMQKRLSKVGLNHRGQSLYCLRLHRTKEMSLVSKRLILQESIKQFFEPAGVRGRQPELTEHFLREIQKSLLQIQPGFCQRYNDCALVVFAAVARQYTGRLKFFEKGSQGTGIQQQLPA